MWTLHHLAIYFHDNHYNFDFLLYGSDSVLNIYDTKAESSSLHIIRGELPNSDSWTLYLVWSWQYITTWSWTIRMGSPLLCYWNVGLYLQGTRVLEQDWSVRLYRLKPQHFPYVRTARHNHHFQTKLQRLLGETWVLVPRSVRQWHRYSWGVALRLLTYRA